VHEISLPKVIPTEVPTQTREPGSPNGLCMSTPDPRSSRSDASGRSTREVYFTAAPSARVGRPFFLGRDWLGVGPVAWPRPRGHEQTNVGRRVTALPGSPSSSRRRLADQQPAPLNHWDHGHVFARHYPHVALPAVLPAQGGRKNGKRGKLGKTFGRVDRKNAAHQALTARKLARGDAEKRD
jgi:hypothetical protein